jgi:tetratricopeptide (TPR) repeat protein
LALAHEAWAQAPSAQLRIAGVTEAQLTVIQAAVAREAAARGISERALAAAAQAAGARISESGHFDAEALAQTIIGQIAHQAETIQELESRLAALTRTDDPIIASLMGRAHAAVHDGRLADADALLAEAEETDLAAATTAITQANARLGRAAAHMAERGRIASLRGDYLAAAVHFARASETVPATEARARWIFRLGQANALSDYGHLFNAPEHLQQAIQLYRQVVLPLAPRVSRPNDWALTQLFLGHALSYLGENGDYQALRDAVSAYRAALQIVTQETAPEGWAEAQTNLADALTVLGERGDNQALIDALVAYRSALEVQSRERSPVTWASTMIRTGQTLFVLSQRGSEQVLNERTLTGAIICYRQALEVLTPSNAPADWAQAQNNLGNALAVLGERGNDQALHDALVAYHAAIEVWTRLGASRPWAQTQNNLGLALTELGRRGDEQALREAIAAFGAALEIRTRAAAPALWADTTYNLARAYQVQGRIDLARATALDALQAYEQVHNTHWANEVRAFISRFATP